MPLNYIFFGGGIILFINSLLFIIPTYKSENWLKEKYLRYLRVNIIIGINVIAILIGLLIAIIMINYIISMDNMYLPLIPP